MPRPTISGSGMPTGMRSMLARIFSCTRRIASSALVPTRKRAVTMTRSSCGLAVDVLDAVDALDDRLERLGDELDRVGRLQPVGAHRDVDHRDADLRLLLARDDEERRPGPPPAPRAGTAASAANRSSPGSGGRTVRGSRLHQTVAGVRGRTGSRCHRADRGAAARGRAGPARSTSAPLAVLTLT